MKALIKSDGSVTSVYRDTNPVHGSQEIKRASNVEFNRETGKWEAEFVDPNNPKIEGTKRDEVIKQEVKHLEQHLDQIK